jgi:hypothetical protein
VDEAQENGNLKGGKSPRRLQLSIGVGYSRHCYELRAIERRFIPKALIANSDLEPNGLDESDRRVVQMWLRRRYDRTALPTEFAERVEPAAKGLRNKLSKKASLVAGVYVDVRPDVELDVDRHYSLSIIFTMAVFVYGDLQRRQEVLQVQAAVTEAIAKCSGIELVLIDTRPEDEITLDDVRQLTRWDYQDYLSYRGDEEERPPAF